MRKNQLLNKRTKPGWICMALYGLGLDLAESGLAFLPAKSSLCHLPVLTGFYRQKMAESGKN